MHDISMDILQVFKNGSKNDAKLNMQPVKYMTSLIDMRSKSRVEMSNSAPFLDVSLLLLMKDLT